MPGNDTVTTKMYAFIALKTSHESILFYPVCLLFHSSNGLVLAISVYEIFWEFLCFVRFPVTLSAFGVQIVVFECYVFHTPCT